ncbi:hypothetical protein JY97_16005 [Alkalispirochaeta odontotermitis]|nr:hypothetical protein JY97_16005 [Alkalispirochaeta odontotermitis]
MESDCGLQNADCGFVVSLRSVILKGLKPVGLLEAVFACIPLFVYECEYLNSGYFNAMHRLFIEKTERSDTTILVIYNFRSF